VHPCKFYGAVMVSNEFQGWAVTMETLGIPRLPLARSISAPYNQIASIGLVGENKKKQDDVKVLNSPILHTRSEDKDELEARYEMGSKLGKYVPFNLMYWRGSCIYNTKSMGNPYLINATGDRLERCAWWLINAARKFSLAKPFIKKREAEPHWSKFREKLK
jgi:hypothetical protein